MKKNNGKPGKGSGNVFNDNLDSFLINKTNDLIYCFNKTGHFTKVNKALCKALQLDQAEIIGKTYYELGFPEEVCKQWDVLLDTVYESNKSISSFSKVSIPERGLFSFHLKLYPITEEDGTIAGVAVITNDISLQENIKDELSETKIEFLSALKKAKEELEESREKYKGLSDAAFESIFLSEKGICIEQNKTAEKVFGYTTEEAIGRYGTEWIVPGDREMVMNNMISGYSEAYEATALRKDGTTFPCILRGKMMQYKGRTVRVTSLSDITERKKTEEALQKEHLLFRTVIDNIPDSVYVKDIEGCKIIANPQDVKYMGFNSEIESIGKNDTEIYTKGEAAKFQNDDDLVLKEGRSILNQLHYFIDNHQEGHWLLTSKVPLRSDQNEIIGLVGIGRDVTERQNMIAQLVKTQDRLNKIILSSADCVWEVNTEVKYTYCSDQIENIIGYTAHEVINRSPFDFIEKNEQERLLPIVTDILINKKDIVNLEKWDIHKDGHAVCVLLNGFPLFDSGGELTGYIGVFTDITEQKIKERKISEINEQLRTLIESMPDAVFMKDGEGRWNTTNSAARDLFNLTDIDWQGKTDKELALIQPEQTHIYEACIRSDNEAWQGAKVKYSIEIIKDKKGKDHQYHVTKVPLFEPDGKRKGLVIIGRDVTKQKEEEVQLKLLEAAIESTSDAITITEINHQNLKDSTLIYVNDACCKMTGFSKEEFIGGTPRILRAENMEEGIEEEINHAILTGESLSKELHDSKKNGEKFWSSFSLTPIANTEGLYTHWIGIKKDITESKKHEIEIKRAMLKGQENEKYFIGRELHDNVAQIMVGIKLNVSMIKGSTEKEIQWLNEIKDDLDNVLHEVRSLSHDLAPSVFKSDNFINTVEGLLKSINKENKFKVSISCDQLDNMDLSIDLKTNLYRILQEQLQNIIKHADATIIAIRFCKVDDFIELSIFDNGKGFNINESYHGIGLKNIKSRVESFSGSYTIRSAKENGCELIVKIPLQ